MSPPIQNILDQPFQYGKMCGNFIPEYVVLTAVCQPLTSNTLSFDAGGLFNCILALLSFH